MLLASGVAALAVIALAVGVLWRGRRRKLSPEELLEFIRGAEKVQGIVIDHRPPRVAFELSTPAAVQSIVSLLALEPKRACNCKHCVGMILHKGQSSLFVEVCDHCLVVWPPSGRRQHYTMPKALWARFCELLRKHRENLDASDQKRVSRLIRPERIPDGVQPQRTTGAASHSDGRDE